MTPDEKVILEIHERQNRPVEPIELECGVDIVIIDKETREVQSITVWQEIRNVERIKRLVARETASYGGECIAVPVKSRSKGLWEVLLDSEVISL